MTKTKVAWDEDVIEFYIESCKIYKKFTKHVGALLGACVALQN